MQYNNTRCTVVLPIASVTMSCHIAPQFHKLEPTLQLHGSLDLLAVDTCFYFNHFYSYYVYMLIEHWRQTCMRA